MPDPEQEEALQQAINWLEHESERKAAEIPTDIGLVDIGVNGKAITFLGAELKPGREITLLEAVEGTFIAGDDENRSLVYPTSFLGRGVVILDDGADFLYRFENTLDGFFRVTRGNKKTGDTLRLGNLTLEEGFFPIIEYGQPVELTFNQRRTGVFNTTDELRDIYATNPPTYVIPNISRALIISGIPVHSPTTGLNRLPTQPAVIAGKLDPVSFFYPPTVGRRGPRH